MTGPNLRGVLLPHAVDPQDVRDLAVALREFELQRAIEPGDVAVYPVIDTARGLLRAAEIVHAAPRVGGLVLDSAAYARDIGARQEEHGPRLAYARGGVVAAARAFEKLPLVVAEPLQLQTLSQYGFAGVLLADARAVTQANAAFTPSDAAVNLARRQAEAYDAARGEGAWVARLGASLVDAHTARKARQVLDG
jgi:citrate lyase subunit beta/citryl-CoA lyase